MMDRKLASIQKIVQIDSIPDTDSIEYVKVLGCACVAKKGQFKVGDYVIYIEIDSLVMPISILGEYAKVQGIDQPIPSGEVYHEGDDVTMLLKINKSIKATRSRN